MPLCGTCLGIKFVYCVKTTKDMAIVAMKSLEFEWETINTTLFHHKHGNRKKQANK